MAEESDEVLLDSFVRVVWDPDGAKKVLVEIGDPMWSPVAIDGEQVVDVAQGSNIVGVRNFPRGNEAHKLTFTLCRIKDTLDDAFETRMNEAMALPRDMRDIVFSLQSGKAWRLKNAAVKSWPTNQRERLTKQNLVILGGEIVAEANAPQPGAGAEVALYADVGISNGTLEPLSLWSNSGTGSMDAVQATGANQPVAIARSMRSGVRVGGLYLPGIAGNYGSVPDTGGLDFSGNFALSWQGKLDSYTPGTKYCLVSKWTAAGNQRSYALFVNPNGTVELQISTDGTAGGVLTYTSTVPTGLAPLTLATLVAERTGSNIRFYVATDAFPQGELFIPPALQLGAVVVGVSTAIFNSTAPLVIGATDAGTANLMRGYTLQARAQNDHVNSPTATGCWLIFYNAVTGATSVIDMGGTNTMTLNRTSVSPAKFVNGYRAQFDGSNDRMDLSSPLQLVSLSGLTLAWYGTLNRVTGLNDLLLCGTNDSTQPRSLLRVDGGDLKALIRRTDSEATATVTFAGAAAQYDAKTLAVSINYAAGTAALFVNGVLVASGALTSSGTTDATSSGITRIMAGVSGANAAAGDVARVVIIQRALDLFEMAALHTTLTTN
ncbi:LamG-like jellyroll fold domain-containing protein [Luteolibacter luteus]|uniref:LamG domain-containing protein n=1 Tax=Luteolibacter luteus TaxID=2728835 RepID=A0A858RIS3_9BACT|nr:LamG-like jellyroll fold domain-containing protein [Luteolibacter luteus]QJE95953.1 LamG domain-containing protein [Luteolibacter luteus]